MSSRDLAETLDFVRTHELNIHSLSIVRNGILVLDAYFYPFRRGLRHDLASVTKSVVSLLVGIATDEGLFAELGQPIAMLLPHEMPAKPDSREEQVRLEDLLAMQSGLRCGFEPGERELHEMMRQRDWAKYALSLPMAAGPGQRFAYCSPNFHILSTALSKAARESTLQFAQAHLFGPLGIRDAYWPADPRGINHGWGDLQLYPEDMAKLGLLMLRGGEWNSRRILPGWWVDSAWTVHAKMSADSSYDYGLGWWLAHTGRALFEAEAVGRGGQRISIVPGKHVVVVMTGGGFDPGELGGYLLKAVASDTALPDDRAGQAKLAEALRLIAAPPSPHRVAHSPRAQDVSGRTYRMKTNPLTLRSFRITFPDSTVAVLYLRLADGTEFNQPLGLDGQYRTTRDEHGAFSAGRGTWLRDGHFRAELNLLTRIDRFTFDVAFEGNRIRITASEPTELGTITLRGHTLPAPHQ